MLQDCGSWAHFQVIDIIIIIVIFTDLVHTLGLGSEKVVSQFALWPIQVWHFVTWSLDPLFSSSGDDYILRHNFGQ